MRKWTSIFLWFCMMSQISFAQVDKPGAGFTGFGKPPVETPDSLLRNWQNAETVEDKFRAMQDLTRFHDEIGAVDSVIIYAKRFHNELAKSEVNELKRLGFSANTDLAIGKAFLDKGLYDESLRHYLHGIQAGEKIQDKSIIDRHRFGMADVYFHQGQVEKSEALYRTILQTTGDENLVQLINSELGSLFLSRNDTARSRAYFEPALDHFKATGQLKNQFRVQLNLATIAEAGGQIDSAYVVYNEVKDKALDHHFFDLYIRSAQKAGEVLLAKKEYTMAQMVLFTVYVNAMEWENLEAQQHAIHSLQEVHAATGDYKNAYALSTQYLRVSAEVMDRQNKNEVNELEVKYQTAQKEKEILAKEGQLRQERTVKYGLLIGFLVVLIPTIGLMYLYYRKLQTQHRLNASMEEASQQKIKAMLREKELELLAASVKGEEKERRRIAQELHDSIGGNLAAIKMQLSQTGGECSRGAIRQLDDTYQLVRDLSHNLIPRKFDNTGFTKLIETYLGHFDSSEGTRINFQAYPEEQVNALPTAVKVEVYKIIQELMTNVQKHAQASQVDVQLTLVEEVLKLIFEDNGKGFWDNKVYEGIGLRNIRERLKTHNGTVHIDSFPKRGTIVDIEIPFNPLTVNDNEI